MNNFVTSEQLRLINNLLRIGIVLEADYAKARLKVKMGELETAWLPWLTQRAGGDRSWWAPEVGEQVMVLSPGGDSSQGVILGALYQESSAKPGDALDENIHRVEYQNGTFIEHDRKKNELNINVQGEMKINVSGNVEVVAEGDVNIDAGGNVAIMGKHTQAITGVVTGESICHFTGSPHGDPSTTVKASK